jgi:hypothetical protein
MSYNQNGNQYPYNNQQRPSAPYLPPPSQQHQNNTQNPTSPYRPTPGNTLADRQNAELFMASPTSPARNRLPQIVTSYPPQPPAHAAYNPGDYTPISPTNHVQPQWPTSPLVSRPPVQTPIQSSYNPASYAPPTPIQRVPAYPAYQQSPHPAFQQQQMPQNTLQARPGQAYPRVSTNFPQQYGMAAPPPLPVIPSAGESPAEDWGQVPQPGVTRYASTRYGNNQTPSSHSRNSSTFSANSVQLSPSAPPPLPPPHGHRTTASGDLNSRPLPRLPSNDSTTDEMESYQQALENQILASVGAGASANGHTSASDSDAEALAGIEAMREAERQEQSDIARRTSGHSTLFSQGSQRAPYPDDSDDDMTTVDLSGLGGGWDAQLSYGGAPDSLAVDRNNSTTSSYRERQDTISSHGSHRRSNVSDHDTYNYVTGGLADPSVTARRLSFDEGDETQMTGEPGIAGYEYFHPGITNRPLPPPPLDTLRHSQSSSAIPQQYRPNSQFDRGASYAGATHPAPNRHTSLVNHSASPPPVTPARAITDADDRKRMKRGSNMYNDRQEPVPTTNVALDLPGVAKRFNPSKLTPLDFAKCDRPWAVSDLGRWLKLLVKDDQYLKKPALIEGLESLFMHKVPTMNIADAEMLAAQVIDEMLANQTLYPEEEWILFSETETAGVLVQLTNSGCYAPRVHSHEISGKCYSETCQRDEKKIALSTEPDAHLQVSWQEYWDLPTEDVKAADKKEVARQNNLHELVQKEEKFLSEMAVLQTVYRDGLRTAKPPILSATQLPSFMKEVFGKVDAVRRVNEEHLVPQIKYRQKEQGPYVGGFSSIYREWIRRAKTAYIEYATAFPNAIYKIKLERERNVMLYGYLENCQKDPRSRRLDYTHYLKVPITHIQQVILLLATILKCSLVPNEERRLLEKAIDEIKKVTQELDARVAAQEGKVALYQLQSKLKFRPEIPKINLNLDHLGRELIYQGELKRTSKAKLSLLDTQAILLDNFLVIARITSKNDSRDLSETYDVTKLPIPIDLLVLESRNDDAVSITNIGGVVRINAVQNPQLVKANTGIAPGNLQHTQSGSSINTLQSTKSAPPAITNLPDQKDDKVIMYPFQVKHLGSETYVLYAANAQSREEWCDNIIKAQNLNARTLFKQNSEPFKLRVLADTAFGLETGLSSSPSIPVKGTPLDRAVREVEAQYANFPKSGPVCRAKVNCATSFTRADGRQMLAIGTDFGVYLALAGDARNWSKVSSYIF